MMRGRPGNSKKLLSRDRGGWVSREDYGSAPWTVDSRIKVMRKGPKKGSVLWLTASLEGI